MGRDSQGLYSQNLNFFSHFFQVGKLAAGYGDIGAGLQKAAKKFKGDRSSPR